jgi:uncharacterized protein
MSGSPQVVVTRAGGGAFVPDPLADHQIVEGSPEATDRHLGTWSDGTTTGVWRCTPGRFTDVEVDETFVVLEGRASIRCGDDVFTVGPGDVCVLPAGAVTEWTVHQTLVKVYVLREPIDGD